MLRFIHEHWMWFTMLCHGFTNADLAEDVTIRDLYPPNKVRFSMPSEPKQRIHHIIQLKTIDLVTNK